MLQEATNSGETIPMSKQSASRSQKSKGSRAMQALQICLVLAICIWLIYQSKQLYSNKEAMEDSSKQVSQQRENRHEMLRLGRKNLNPRLDEQAAEFGTHQDEELELEDESGGDQEKTEEGEHEQLDDLIDEDDKEE